MQKRHHSENTVFTELYWQKVTTLISYQNQRCWVVVATGLEPVVSLRSASFAMVASRRCRLRGSLAQYASTSLHPAPRALGSGAPSI